MLDVCEFVCVCVAIFLVFGLGPSFKLHVQVQYDLTRCCLKGATRYYLTLAEYDRCPKLSHRNELGSLRRGAWDRVVLILCTCLLSIQATQ